jgi:hypothetical protein
LRDIWGSWQGDLKRTFPVTLAVRIVGEFDISLETVYGILEHPWGQDSGMPRGKLFDNELFKVLRQEYGSACSTSALCALAHFERTAGNQLVSNEILFKVK